MAIINSGIKSAKLKDPDEAGKLAFTGDFPGIEPGASLHN
jgi:hypothetical protein